MNFANTDTKVRNARKRLDNAVRLLSHTVISETEMELAASEARRALDELNVLLDKAVDELVRG